MPKQDKADTNLKQIQGIMSKTAYPILTLLFTVFIMAVTYLMLGIVPMIVFSIFLIGGFIAWIKTTYHIPVNPNKIIIPYLLSVIFFIIHVCEEYLSDFSGSMSELSGFHIPEKNFLLIAAFAAPVFWLSGAVLLLKRNPFGYYLTWGFFIAMVYSELAHFVFPFIKDGKFGYFPGMYTALLPLIPAVYGMKVILKEYQQLKNNSNDKALAN